MPLARVAPLAALAAALASCAVTHPRAAPGWRGACEQSAVRTVLLLRPRVAHRVLYIETDYAAPAPGGDEAAGAAFERAAREALSERGYRVLTEAEVYGADAGGGAERLRGALRAAAFAAFEADLEYERPSLSGAAAPWEPPPGAEAVLWIEGEAVSETRRARFRRLLRNYTLNLLQLPLRVGAVFLLPTVPIPNIQVYEDSPSRLWLQAALARAEDGRLLYVNDLSAADSLLVEDAARDAVGALLEDAPEALQP